MANKKFEKVTPLWGVSYKGKNGTLFKGGMSFVNAKDFAKTKKFSIIHKSVLAYV